MTCKSIGLETFPLIEEQFYPLKLIPFYISIFQLSLYQRYLNSWRRWLSSITNPSFTHIIVLFLCRNIFATSYTAHTILYSSRIPLLKTASKLALLIEYTHNPNLDLLLPLNIMYTAHKRYYPLFLENYLQYKFHKKYSIHI